MRSLRIILVGIAIFFISLAFVLSFLLIKGIEEIESHQTLDRIDKRTQIDSASKMMALYDSITTGTNNQIGYDYKRIPTGNNNVAFGYWAMTEADTSKCSINHGTNSGCGRCVTYGNSYWEEQLKKKDKLKPSDSTANYNTGWVTPVNNGWQMPMTVLDYNYNNTPGYKPFSNDSIVWANVYYASDDRSIVYYTSNLVVGQHSAMYLTVQDNCIVIGRDSGNKIKSGGVLILGDHIPDLKTILPNVIYIGNNIAIGDTIMGHYYPFRKMLQSHLDSLRNQ